MNLPRIQTHLKPYTLRLHPNVLTRTKSSNNPARTGSGDAFQPLGNIAPCTAIDCRVVERRRLMQHDLLWPNANNYAPPLRLCNELTMHCLLLAPSLHVETASFAFHTAEQFVYRRATTVALTRHAISHHLRLQF
eukprot:595279-Amphidinium_carterae.1